MIHQKFEKVKERYLELEKLLADPQVIGDQSQYQSLAKEYSGISPVFHVLKEHEECLKQIEELEKIVKEKQDDDLVELAESELKDLEIKKTEVLDKLEKLTNPKRKESNRDIILEIRAGTGGQEASLFAADLYRMYTKYADKKGWKLEPINSNASEAGGFKEVIFSISGKGAEKRLQFESGAHRVQRVPTTEASGRIHTSAATVAVLLEPEEVELKVDPKDLRIDIFHSSGPGGQSVNTTDSAVRITHIPTGTVVICQDERSQLKNKHKAMRVLRARILDKVQQDHHDVTSKERKLKVGTGDRSEKIRTYNFPDRRVTDHRIGFTSHKLNFIMDGELDELTDALIKANNEAVLE